MESKKTFLNKISALNIDVSELINDEVNSFTSLSGDNQITFLMDVLRTLETQSEIQKVIIDVLVNSSTQIEDTIKDALKEGINKLTFCSVDTKIPNTFTQQELIFDLDVIDTWGIFNVSVDSENSKLVFDDIASGFRTSDLNTFIALCIKNRGVYNSWYYNGNKIFDLKYDSNINYKNCLVIRIPESYKGKKVAKFFSDFIDSVKLFDLRLFINKMVNDFGNGISSLTSKSFETSFNGAMASAFIGELVDDELGKFSNKEVAEFFTTQTTKLSSIEGKTRKMISGLHYSENMLDDLNVTLPTEKINDLLENSTVLSKLELNDRVGALLGSGGLSVLSSGVDNIPNASVFNASSAETMIKNLSRSYMEEVLSPKLRLSFELANKLMDLEHEAKEFKDFVSENLNILKTISGVIKKLVVDVLLNKCLKLIRRLVENKIERIVREKIINTKKQKKSLLK